MTLRTRSLATCRRKRPTGIGGNQADNSAWSQQAYIKASNTNTFDVFCAPLCSRLRAFDWTQARVTPEQLLIALGALAHIDSLASQGRSR